MARRASGLTLIELLVGLALMALLSMMSWRGLDMLLRSQARLQDRGSALAGLQAALAQWILDLEQAVDTPYLNALSWDGRQLRIVRRLLTEDALVVVAWGPRHSDAGTHWWRWQSAPVRDRAALLGAWAQAPTALAEAASDPPAALLVPIEGWELLYHQGAGWTQAAPLRALGGTPPPLVEPPAGVRLRLQLPTQAGLSGTLQLDWANPSQQRGRP